MKAQASYICHLESDSKDSKFKFCTQQSSSSTGLIDLSSDGAIDLTKDHEQRRAERKAIKHARGTDVVYFVDLPGTADYDKFFAKCIDPNIKLNVKGPFADRWWGFTAIDETRESNERRVSTNDNLI